MEAYQQKGGDDGLNSGWTKKKYWKIIAGATVTGGETSGGGWSRDYGGLEVL